MEFLQNLKTAEDAGITKDEFLQIWKKEREETLLKLEIQNRELAQSQTEIQAPHADELPMSKTESLICKQIQEIHQEVIGVKEELRILQAKFMTNVENEGKTKQPQSEGAVSGIELRNEMQKLEHLISSGFEAHNRSLKSFVTQEIDALKASLEDKLNFFSETSSDVVDYVGNIDPEMASQSMDKEDQGEKMFVPCSQHHEKQDPVEIINEDFVDVKTKTLQESIESDKRVSETGRNCLWTDQDHQQEEENGQTAELGLGLNTLDVTNKALQESSNSVSETESGYLKTDQDHEQEGEKSQSTKLVLGQNTVDEINKTHEERNKSETDRECLGTHEDCQHDEEETQTTELSLKTVDVTKETVEESGGSVDGDQKVEEDQQSDKDPLDDLGFDFVNDPQKVPEENTDSEEESHESDSDILGEEQSDLQDSDQSEENLRKENVGQDSVVTKNTSSLESISFDVNSPPIECESSEVFKDQQQKEGKVRKDEKDLNTGIEINKVPVESSDLDAGAQEIAQGSAGAKLGVQIGEKNLEKEEQALKVKDVYGQSFQERNDSESSTQITDGESDEEELVTFQNSQQSQEDPVPEVQSLESADSYYTAREGSTDSEEGSHPVDPESADEFVALEDDQQTDTNMQMGKESQVAIGNTNKGLTDSSDSDACIQGMEQKCTEDQSETKQQDSIIQTDLTVTYYDPKMNKETSNENTDSEVETNQATDEEGLGNVFEKMENCQKEYLPIDDCGMCNEKDKEGAVSGLRDKKLDEAGPDDSLEIRKEYLPTYAANTAVAGTNKESSNGCIDSDESTQTKDKVDSGDALEHDECFQKKYLPIEGAVKSNVKSDESIDSDASCQATDQRDSDNAFQQDEKLKKDNLLKDTADMNNGSSDDCTDSNANSQASEEGGPGNTLEREKSFQKESLPVDDADADVTSVKCNASSESWAWSEAMAERGPEDTSEHVEKLDEEHLLIDATDENNESSNGRTDQEAINLTSDKSCSDFVLQHANILQKENQPKDIGDMKNELSNKSSDSDASSQTRDEEGTGNGLEHEKRLQKEDPPMNAADMSSESSDENYDSDGSCQSTEEEGAGDTLAYEYPSIDDADKSNGKSSESPESGKRRQVSGEKDVQDRNQNNESSPKEYLPKNLADKSNVSSNDCSDSDASSQATEEDDSDDVLQHEEILQQEYLSKDFTDMNDESTGESSDSDASGKARDEESTRDTFQHEESLQKLQLPMDDTNKNKESSSEKFDSDRGSKATDDGDSDVTVPGSQDSQKPKEVSQQEDVSVSFVQVYHKTAEESIELEPETKAESSSQDGQQYEDQFQIEYMSQGFVVVNNNARQDRTVSDDSAQTTDLACPRNYQEDQYDKENNEKELTFFFTEYVKKKVSEESIDYDESVSRTDDRSLYACQENSQQCEKVLKEDLGLPPKYTDSVGPLYATGCPKSLHQEGSVQDKEMGVSSSYVHNEPCTENTNSDVSNEKEEERNPDKTLSAMSSQQCEEDLLREEMSFEFVDLIPKTLTDGYDLYANRHAGVTENHGRDAVCDLQIGEQPKENIGAEDESYIATVVNNKASQEINDSNGTIRTIDPGRQFAIQEDQIEKKKAQKQEEVFAKSQESTNFGADILEIDPKNSGSQKNNEELSQKRDKELFISSYKTLTNVQRKDQRSTEDDDDGQQPKEKLQTEEMNYSSLKLANSAAKKYTPKMGEVKEKSFLYYLEDKSPEISSQALTKPATQGERASIGNSDGGSDSQFQDPSNRSPVAHSLPSACETMDSGFDMDSTSSSCKLADKVQDTDDTMEKDEPMLTESEKCTQQFEVKGVETMLLTQNPSYTHHFYIHPNPFKVRLGLSFNSRGRFDICLRVASSSSSSDPRPEKTTKLPMVLNGSVSIFNESSSRYTKLCAINNEEFSKPNHYQEIGLNLPVVLKTCRRVYHDVTYHTLMSKGFIFHNGMRFKCEIEAYEKTPTSQ